MRGCLITSHQHCLIHQQPSICAERQMLPPANSFLPRCATGRVQYKMSPNRAVHFASAIVLTKFSRGSVADVRGLSGSTNICRRIAINKGIGMRLLLVEDEVEIQKFLRRALTEAGFDVDTASDTGTAMKCVADAAYNVLVVDGKRPSSMVLGLFLHFVSRSHRSCAHPFHAVRSTNSESRGRRRRLSDQTICTG
jgi:hypothetical protein